jgi:LemA protein
MGIDTVLWSAGALVVLGYVVLVYNGLVALKHNASKAWANIDVLLKQRGEELPKLVETCKQYMAHEKDTLERVIKARSAVASAAAAGDVAAVGAAEGELRGLLGRLFAVAEAYPDLKANETFRHLQSRITQLEHAIADRREFYNESVNVNNVRIEQFPDVIVARAFGFGARALFEISEAERKDVDVKALFG